MRISKPITLFTKDLSFYHSLLKSCVHGDNSSSPLTVFRDLLRSSLTPNHFTMSILLQASSTSIGSLKLVQTHLKKSGIDRFVYVKTSLLDLYLKMGFVATAGKLFDEMPERDTVAWNAMICGYSRNGYERDAWHLFITLHETPLISWNSVISGCVQSGRASTAFEIFHKMSLSDGHVLPDAITIASLLAGCSQLSCLPLGKTLHGYILRNSFGNEKFVCTALIDMYAKCGNAELSERVFKTIDAPCTATWNSMISGYSLSGLQSRALSCYLEMREQGSKPDKITFLGVLSACTHGGLVDEGRVYFIEMIKEFGISPNLQHYALMVGLLGRACLFSEAVNLIWEMDMKADSAVWGALLSACIVNREVEIGEYVAKKMFMLDYRNGGLYVLMSNLYATEEMWDDVSRVRRMMKDNGYDGYLGVSQTL
ncbi:hypothetical protein DY000_02005099 [Brassica cretica]|uniref:Pentacotripeptide-repeat region of PRORP domain-containing protein n=1 Tax=Brassica cretica TaxID=69181 RepID=A0ABQ7CL06_BRACR|nr:hypothetical protein DY000_02005099 [Brassica cretica]